MSEVTDPSTSDEELPRTLKTQEQAEIAMYRLGAATRSAEALKLERDNQVAEIKESYREPIDAITKTMKSLKRKLETWANKQHEAWRNEKRESLDLTHGRVGFRYGSSNKISPFTRDKQAKEKALIAKLEELGLTHCIAVHKTVDFQALAKESDETLAVCGVKRVGSTSKFYADPRTDRFAERLPAKPAAKGVA